MDRVENEHWRTFYTIAQIHDAAAAWLKAIRRQKRNARRRELYALKRLTSDVSVTSRST